MSAPGSRRSTASSSVAIDSTAAGSAAGHRPFAVDRDARRGGGVVGLQVIGRHVLRQPFPWTEEIARLLLVWLMCVGGVAALRGAQLPA